MDVRYGNCCGVGRPFSTARRPLRRSFLPPVGIRGRDSDRNWRGRGLNFPSKSSNTRIPRKAFEVLPRRWAVERTSAWLNRCRQLAEDLENLTRDALTFIKLASVRLMLRKLCNPK
jgi:transposase